MSFIAVAVAAVAVTSVYRAQQEKKARRRARDAQRRADEQARKDAKAERDAARKAEVFSETEGQALGNIGRISLELDNKIDPREKKLRTGSSSLRI